MLVTSAVLIAAFHHAFPAVLLTAVKTAEHATLFSRLLSAGQVAAALGAISAVGIFLWTRLRMDKSWKWLFRHIQEDKKKARLAELVEVMEAPEIRRIRKTEVLDSIAPELQDLHSCVDRIGKKVELIASRQVDVANDLIAASLTVEEVAKRLEISEAKRDREALVVIDHIADDAEFQAKVLPILETQKDFQDYMVEGKAFMAGFKAHDDGDNS